MKMMHDLRSLWAVVLILGFGMAGCGPGDLVFEQKAEPEAFMLSFKKPEVFEFEIAEAGEYDFAMELEYYSEQMQEMNGRIPMYYILEGPGMGDGKDRQFDIQVKEDNGEWKGELTDNEHDREFETNFEKDMELQPGKYKFKLYANSDQEGTPVQGIVTIVLRIYK